MAEVSQQATALARWSDGPGLAAAVDLAERHRELLGTRLAPAQIAGLQALARAARDSGEVIAYAQNQGTRARRTGRFDAEAFWRDAGEALDRGRADAERAGVECPLRFLQDFIQHLAAHSLYLRRATR